MLHFLAGVALLIFIGERSVWYYGIWKLQREERRAMARAMAMLYPPSISMPKPEPAVSIFPTALAIFGLVVGALGLVFMNLH